MGHISIASDIEVINSQPNVVIKALVAQPDGSLKEFKSAEVIRSVALGQGMEPEEAVSALENHCAALKTKAAYQLMDYLMEEGYL